jgi:cytochrome P450
MNERPPVNLTDPQLYLRGEALSIFAELRARSPLFWQTLEADGYWAVLGYDEVLRVSSEPALFSSARGSLLEDAPPAQKGSLITTDPPAHARLRTAVEKPLMRKGIQHLEAEVRQISRELIGAALQRGSIDFVADVASQLPLRTFCRLMNVDRDEEPVILDLTEKMVDALETGSPQDLQDAGLRMGAHGLMLAQKHRQRGEVDLIGAILSARVDGEPLSDEEFSGLFMQLALAANETTRTLLCYSVECFADDPGLQRELGEDRTLLPGAIEEFLRRASPIIYQRRTATQDVDLAGRQVRAGQKLLMYYPSANHDETRFADPLRLDIRRTPNRHVAFGTGEHFCLGARLARMEARVFLEEFLDAVVTSP